MKQKTILLFASIFFAAAAWSQPAFETYLYDYQYYIFNNDIHTLQIYQEGMQSSIPAVTVNSSEKLTCGFDDFDISGKNYQYTFFHCTPEWKISNGIQQSDYMTGYYYEDYVRDYTASFNTLRDYLHYSFTFPNDNINTKISGNYALVVYEEDINKPAFIARFFIYDNLVNISPTIGYSKSPKELQSHQKANFIIKQTSYRIDNPYSNLYVVIQQNGRTYNVQGGIPPRTITNDKLYYDYDEYFIFNGNNEFRLLSLTSFKHLTRSMVQIETYNSEYYITLDIDNTYKGRSYQTLNDINGKFLIEVENVLDSDTEAEYAYTMFTLKDKIPFPQTEAYICGDFNGWQMDENNKMTYNYQTGCYEATLYLKQGYYNYTYILKDHNGQINDIEFDGNYVDAKNDYTFYAYYKAPGDYYYQLIALNVFSAE
ncbi:MAG: DUF5103 domain-containing protein [Bacteroidales bacterium]|nr:DUF5103 domain-containing protein [Bacteroidales bacterium]